MRYVYQSHAILLRARLMVLECHWWRAPSSVLVELDIPRETRNDGLHPCLGTLLKLRPFPMASGADAIDSATCSTLAVETLDTKEASLILYIPPIDQPGPGFITCVVSTFAQKPCCRCLGILRS